MDRLRRHLLAAVAMVLGSGAVFFFLVAMNAYTEPPKDKAQKVIADFSVEKPPPKKKERKPRPQRQRRTAQAQSPRAPTPNLAGGLSSVSLELPGFDMGTAAADTQGLLGDVKKDVVMDERSVDEPPRAVSRVAPDSYPEKARKQGVEGFVKMSLLIGESGDVERVKVLEAQPAGVFDDVAVATIRRWRFEPAIYQAQHVRVWATQTMRFELN